MTSQTAMSKYHIAHSSQSDAAEVTMFYWLCFSGTVTVFSCSYVFVRTLSDLLFFWDKVSEFKTHKTTILIADQYIVATYTYCVYRDEQRRIKMY